MLSEKKTIEEEE